MAALFFGVAGQAGVWRVQGGMVCFGELTLCCMDNKLFAC